MVQAVPNLCVRKVFLKHQVIWTTVCGAVQDLPCNIWSADNPVEVLNEHLSLLVGRYVPTKVIRDHPQWTRDRSRVNWEEFVK